MKNRRNKPHRGVFERVFARENETRVELAALVPTQQPYSIRKSGVIVEGGFITALAQDRRLIRSIQKCSPLQLRLHTLLLTIRHTGWDPLQRIRIGAVCLELQAARV
jgi:hypothetical protein